MSKFIDRTGQTFGRLKVIKRGFDRSGKTAFSCLCTCGVTKDIAVSSLLSGLTKSCGCLNSEVAKRRKPKDVKKETPRNMVKSAYLFSAKKKSLGFDLTDSEFNDLIFSRCFYCDTEPTGTSRSTRQEVRYNGIDRMDNDLGYTKENCVPCCKVCNYMKRSLSLVDFITRCRQIVETFDAAGT